MEKELELYQEEQREQLIKLNGGIQELLAIFKGDVAVKVKNLVDKQEVTGSVQVSNQKDDITVKNIDLVVNSLEELSADVTKAIEANKVQPLSEVSIKNIKDAKQDVVSIKNLSDLKTYFDGLSQALKDNQPVINIQKQVVEFPTSPKKPVAVRLSDGRSFYNALSIAMGSAFNASGLSTSAKQDEIITAIGNIGGSTNYTTRIAENSGDANITYIGNAVIGTATSAASWQIKRLDATSGLIKLWSGGTDAFDKVWDDREAGSYS